MEKVMSIAIKGFGLAFEVNLSFYKDLISYILD
jgi:hypothetical protein